MTCIDYLKKSGNIAEPVLGIHIWYHFGAKLIHCLYIVVNQKLHVVYYNADMLPNFILTKLILIPVISGLCTYVHSPIAWLGSVEIKKIKTSKFHRKIIKEKAKILNIYAVTNSSESINQYLGFDFIHHFRSYKIS